MELSYGVWIILLTSGASITLSCPVWQMVASTSGSGGTSVTGITTLDECKTACLNQSGCGAVDFRLGSPPVCAVYVDYGYVDYVDYDNGTIRNNTTYSHYRLKERCPQVACPAWEEFPLTRSRQGEKAVDVTSLEQCRSLCLKRRGCRTVDYRRERVRCYIHDRKTGTTSVNSTIYDQHRLAAPCKNTARCPFWKRLRFTAGKGGVKVGGGINTTRLCQLLCRRQANCRVIDFSIRKSEYPCALYYEDDRIYSIRSSNFNQYHLAKPCRNMEACGMPVVSPTISNIPLEQFTGKTGEIVSGVPARQSSWPWTVYIEAKAGRVVSKCGGSILNHRWVITAAHCVRNTRDTSQIRLGFGVHRVSRSRPSGRVDRVVRLNSAHDIVLLRTAERIRYSFRVQPVCLPDRLAPENTDCVAVGWGKTQGTLNENYLNQLQLKSDHHSTCDNVYFCTKYRRQRNVCSGDSGGPLACKVLGVWHLYGVTQGVMVYKGGDNNCIAVDEPARFMRILLYKSWILHTIHDVNVATNKSDAMILIAAILATVAVCTN